MVVVLWDCVRFSRGRSRPAHLSAARDKTRAILQQLSLAKPAGDNRLRFDGWAGRSHGPRYANRSGVEGRGEVEYRWLPLLRLETESLLRDFRRPDANALQFEHPSLGLRAAWRGETADFAACGQHAMTGND